jgi:hypothetical protein
MAAPIAAAVPLASAMPAPAATVPAGTAAKSAPAEMLAAISESPVTIVFNMSLPPKSGIASAPLHLQRKMMTVCAAERWRRTAREKIFSKWRIDERDMNARLAFRTAAALPSWPDETRRRSSTA